MIISVPPMYEFAAVAAFLKYAAQRHPAIHLRVCDSSWIEEGFKLQSAGLAGI
jgi:hypothetical protein